MDVCYNTPIDSLAHPGSQGKPCGLLLVLISMFSMSTWSVGHSCGLKFNIFLVFCYTEHGIWHTTLFFDRCLGISGTKSGCFDPTEEPGMPYVLVGFASPLYAPLFIGLNERPYGAVSG